MLRISLSRAIAVSVRHRVYQLPQHVRSWTLGRELNNLCMLYGLGVQELLCRIDGILPQFGNCNCLSKPIECLLNDRTARERLYFCKKGGRLLLQTGRARLIGFADGAGRSYLNSGRGTIFCRTRVYVGETSSGRDNKNRKEHKPSSPRMMFRQFDL